MDRNIGKEFNLAVWHMNGRSAKFKLAKYSIDVDFTNLHIYAAIIVPDSAHAEIMAH